jgi:hypothetical protein
MSAYHHANPENDVDSNNNLQLHSMRLADETCVDEHRNADQRYCERYRQHEVKQEAEERAV